ncbi:MAG: carboxypeptidase-like regulatory domain-containing protein [Candidatus Eisenbacteria bacterium]|nr:carboxypeptidase-like regulatory domain-containing protein [Candidatus Eisenbacteria bacterium]
MLDRPARLFLFLTLLFVFSVPSPAQQTGTGTLAGTVKDAETGEPVEWADVVILETNKGGIVQQNGRFEVKYIPPGTYHVKVWMNGYNPLIEKSVEISPNDTTTVHFLLHEIGYIPPVKQEELRKLQEERAAKAKARRIDEDREPLARAAADSANSFAWDLYGILAETEGNLFFSPFSVSMALAMTYAGAAGETKEEMARTLHFSGDDEHLHTGWMEIRESLIRGSGEGVYELSIANRLFGESEHRFRKRFLSITEEEYGASLEEVDFRTDTEGARLTINRWVEEETRNRIRDLIPPGGVNTLTRLVLANAIYFKGLWVDAFKKDKTRDEPFYLLSGDTLSVPMMVDKRDCLFSKYEEDGLRVLAMPYQPGQISLVILLPDRIDGLADLEKKLTAERIDGWIEGAKNTEVAVLIPPFRIEDRFNLSDALFHLGMKTAFSDVRADFSEMAEEEEIPLFLSEVFHKSFVEVNEEGTEAAAATAVVMETLGLSTHFPPEFRADHPFLFLIRDKVTGAILFLGRVVDPTAG